MNSFVIQVTGRIEPARLDFPFNGDRWVLLIDEAEDPTNRIVGKTISGHSFDVSVSVARQAPILIKSLEASTTADWNNLYVARL